MQINGIVCQSPATLSVPRNKPLFISCEKDGYFSSQRTIASRLNGVGALDAVTGAFLLYPLAGLFMPGAYSLDSTDVQIELIPIHHPMPRVGN